MTIGVDIEAGNNNNRNIKILLKTTLYCVAIIGSNAKKDSLLISS